MSTNDKLERMMNLAAALLAAERPLTAADIAERVSGYPTDKVAFRRSFERDKADLRDLDVPIRTEEVPGSYPPESGYRIDRADYELPDPGLAADELAALRLALQAVRIGDADQATDGSEALWKLGGVVEADPDDPTGGTATAAGGPAVGGGTTVVASLPTHPALVPVFTAVLERRRVTFTYSGASGPAVRTVDPWRLDHQRGRWYLTGHDHLRGEQRNFRLDRMVDDVVLGDAGAFDRPERRDGGPRQPWEYGDGDPVVAELRVDPDQARWARRQLGDDVPATTGPDGSVTFAVPVTSWPAFRGFVLSFLDGAELLAPADLRADLVAFLVATAEGTP